MATELEQLSDMLEMVKRLDGHPLSTKNKADFRRAMRAAVRGLWQGYFDGFDFVDQFRAALTRGLTQAWHAGAAECGIKPDEFSDDETRALNNLIYGQLPYAPGFANEIITERERQAEEGAVAGTLAKYFNRVDVWVNRYDEAKNQARVMACADKKLRWTLGRAEHCSSCVKLDGKVKRASYWYDNGIIPRVLGAPYLECRGYRCQCSLVPTDEPLSKGPLPKLP